MVRLVATVWLMACALPLAAGKVVKGPYLQDARTDRITVACETDTATSCSVSWGEGLANSVPLSASGNNHQGVISGLSPSSCYPYQLTCGAETSPQSTFCSAPPPGEPFSFVLFGDTRTNHNDHRRIVERIAAEKVDFYVHTGDLVATGSSESDWRVFFEIEGELMREIPLYPTVGNHDETSGNVDIYRRLFAVPTDSSGDERYYSFSYGNARFVILDNQSISGGIQGQIGWAQGEFEEARASADIDHLLVLAHAGMYSSVSGRGGDRQLRDFRNTMKELGVDYVFSGHDHYYERGEADNGLPYVISGGGGAPLYNTVNPTEGTPIQVSSPAHTVFYSKKLHHYLRIDIHGPHFRACAKDSSGVAFDCFEYGEQPRLAVISISPADSTVLAGGSADFAASCRNQAGSPYRAAVSWSVSAGGSMSPDASYGAVSEHVSSFVSDGTPGDFTVSAAAEGIAGSAAVRVETIELPLRINCGSNDYDVAGWNRDDLFFTGGTDWVNPHEVDTAGVANAAPARVYQSVRRQSPHSYRLPVPDGNYLLRLHFADAYENRSMNYRVDGTPILTGFDIVSEAGANRALVKDFAVTVSGGEGMLLEAQSDGDVFEAGLEIIPTAVEEPRPDGDGGDPGSDGGDAGELTADAGVELVVIGSCSGCGAAVVSSPVLLLLPVLLLIRRRPAC